MEISGKHNRTFSSGKHVLVACTVVCSVLILATCCATFPCSDAVAESSNAYSELRAEQNSLLRAAIEEIGSTSLPSVESVQTNLEQVATDEAITNAYSSLENTYNYEVTENLTVDVPMSNLFFRLKYHKVTIAVHDSPEVRVELKRTDISNYALAESVVDGATEISVTGDFTRTYPTNCAERSIVRILIPQSGITHVKVVLEVGSLRFRDLGAPVDISIGTGGIIAEKIRGGSELSIDHGSIYLKTLEDDVSYSTGTYGGLYAIEATDAAATIEGKHAIIDQFEADLTSLNSSNGVSGYAEFPELAARTPPYASSNTYAVDSQPEVSVVIHEKGVRFVFLHTCDEEQVSAIIEQHNSGYELAMCAKDETAHIHVSGTPSEIAQEYGGDQLGALVLFVPVSVAKVTVRYTPINMNGVVFGSPDIEDIVSVSGGQFRTE